MDSLFLVVAGLVALGLFVLIARALTRMDREERERSTDVLPPQPQPPDRTRPPVAPPAHRDIPAHLLDDVTPAPVRFSAHYPKEAAPDAWQPLLGYVFRETAAGDVRDDALRQLGARAGEFRDVEQPATQPVAEGALVTATPVLDGFQVNPPSQSIAFYEPWHRFDFKVRPTTAPVGQAVNGWLTFSVEGIIVADVPLSVFVGASTPTSTPHSATAKPYDAIFCSYSRQDKHIVERIERAYRILGLTYLRDMTTIRSGEDWNEALKRMIERADIFQLFWSHTAAASRHVQMEWEYALSLPGKPSNFIRPVFWQQPMPPVPDPLRHIHFAYDDTLDDV